MEALALFPFAGDLERFASEDLYPYRYPLLIGLVVGAIAAVFIAYRLDLHLWTWKNRLYTMPALGIFLIFAVPFGYYTLSPLFDRDLVCEASPIPGAGSGSEDCDGVALAAGTETAAPADGPSGGDATPVATDAPSEPTDAPAGDFQPRVVYQGELQGADDFHFGEGDALIIETEPGVYVLRFEEFSVRNGPDLFVYLSSNPDGYNDDALNLGGLKGTDGAFNYDVPEGTDVGQFQSAVIWCRDFSVLFAHATLTPA